MDAHGSHASGGHARGSMQHMVAAGVAGALLGAAASLALYRAFCLSSSSSSSAATQQQQGCAHSRGDSGAAAAAAAGTSAGAAHKVSVRNFTEDDVLSEQLTRNVQFFGEAPQQAIANAFVVVVGLGGVGSHAAHLLLRSGVGKLRLIDFDMVTLSSLNRHAVATRDDVGTPKATCLASHFARMVPEAEVEAVVEMYTSDKEEQLLGGNPNFVIDAIDNLDTKAALIAACKRRGLKIIMSAGAGAKADPTRLRVADLSEASIDPLAKAVRQKLRSDYGIWGEVPVLLSLERPRCKLVDHVGFDDAPEIDPLDYQIIPNFRVRTIPVLGTMPAIFGMACAAYVLCHLAGAPWESEPISRPLSKEYTRLLKELCDREMATHGDACPPFPLDVDDVVYISRELWRGFSARHTARTLRPGGQKGFTRNIANLTMARWDNAKPPNVDNIVLLTHDEAEAHASTTIEQLRESEPNWVHWVESLLGLARRQYFY